MYRKPSRFSRSAWCFMWSESLSSQINFSSVGGPMLTEAHTGSIIHRLVQALRADSPSGEIERLNFSIKWRWSAYPSILVENLRLRQRPANNKEDILSDFWLAQMFFSNSLSVLMQNQTPPPPPKKKKKKKSRRRLVILPVGWRLTPKNMA